MTVLTAFAREIESLPPWLAPYREAAQRVANAADQTSVAAALNAARDAKADIGKFVAHAELPADEPYEAFIARTRSIPTRDNAHDLFNGLAWLTFPQTKRRMNQLQAQQIATRGVSGPRGAVRDALTVFDENGALLRAPRELTDALRERDWHRLFIAYRSLWESAQLVLFGHALIEKLMQPRKPITAHVWLIEDLADEAIAASLTLERLASKTFLPLPVLGVPGWWPENEESGFYDDAAVFRPNK